LNFKVARTAIVATLLTSCCLAENLQVSLAVEALIKTRLERGVVGPGQRQATIRELFTDEECMVEEQPIDKKAGNVICTLSGQTSSTIVVGGHFDFADRGQGIVDDWSGTSLLPSLYRALKVVPRRHTYVFVAFAAEERGSLGSSRYVKSLPKERKALIRAFVNLECLGLTSPKVWLSRSTPELASRLSEVATALQLDLQGVNVEQVGDDDTHPFLSANIPVISIHSVTQDTLPVLHSVRDRLSAIHFDDYYASYRLIATYLAYLDAKLE